MTVLKIKSSDKLLNIATRRLFVVVADLLFSFPIEIKKNNKTAIVAGYAFIISLLFSDTSHSPRPGLQHMLQPQRSQLIVKIILKQSIHIWQTAVLLISWNFNWILANDSSVSLLTWNEKTCCNSHTSMEFNVILRVTENAVYWRLARWFISVEMWVVLLFCNFLLFWCKITIYDSTTMF